MNEADARPLDEARGRPTDDTLPVEEGTAPTDRTFSVGEGQAASTDETLSVGAGAAQAGDVLPTGVPRTFGRYRVLGVIGRGGMGIVYRAHDPNLDRDVALKVLIAGEGASPEQIERFFREAASAARLHHPNIVPIHELDVFEGKHYFTMDCIEGHGLDDIIKHEGMEPRKALEIVEKVARAVHYAHEQGIIHRDLKPSNIIIDQSGEPHVTDFGLAKELGEEAGLTRTGAALGTPAYMSPEQAEGRKDIDARSDVYSLGAVLYEMLTKRPPFASDSIFKLLRMAVDEEPVAPCKVGVMVPADAETICLKCLEKDPDRRYGTAAELADDCRRFLEGDPIRARPAGAWYRLRKKLGKHRALAAGATTAVLAAFVAAAFAMGLWGRIARSVTGWELVVDEDFSRELPEGWEVIWGKAKVVDGALVAEGLEFVVLLPGESPDSVRLEYEAWLPEGTVFEKTCDLSCILHIPKEDPSWTGYMLQFGSIGNRCSQIRRERADLVRDTSDEALIVPGKKHHIVAEHSGEHVTLAVDGKELLRLRDFFPLRGGKAGLYSCGNGARFDNVRLYRQGRALDISVLAVPDRFFERGNHRAAAEEYDAICASHPQEPEGRVALYKGGLAGILLGETDTARQAFEALLDTELKGWARMGLAELEARAGRGADAVRELNLARSSGDEEAAAMVHANALRLAYEAAERVDSRTATALLLKYREGLAGWEAERTAQFALYAGMASSQKGRYDAAIVFFESVIAAFPDLRPRCAEAAHVIGSSLREQGRFEEAVRAYERVAEDYPDQRSRCAAATLHTGRAFAESGRFDEAVSVCERVEREYPDERGQCARAALCIGHALRGQGKLDEAVPAYERVGHDYPDEPRYCARAVLWKAACEARLETQGGRAEALQVLRARLREEPAASAVRVESSADRLARFFRGEFDEVAFLKDLESEPRYHHNDAAFDAAGLFETLGDAGAAEGWYRKCLELTQGEEYPAFLARRRLKERGTADERR